MQTIGIIPGKKGHRCGQVVPRLNSCVSEDATIASEAVPCHISAEHEGANTQINIKLRQAICPVIVVLDLDNGSAVACIVS